MHLSLLSVLMYLLTCMPSQKRLEQKPGVVTATPTGTPATPAATPKVIVGTLSGQGTPSTKVVLSTKMGTPVTFQQSKNFQQSFATWVKQGQSTQGTSQRSVTNSLLYLILGEQQGSTFYTLFLSKLRSRAHQDKS